MLIGGEKYACEACVRGHRVSNCQHADRQLQHIAKKGRPVSQCTHCRTLRKARSAHVKCDCGEKAHSKAACTHSKEGDSNADPCCCSHGGRCACALKREHLGAVREDSSDEASSTLTPLDDLRRPRAHTINSDAAGLTVFNNGHHKPAHRHNQMAHKCGLPYVVPRAHTIHGSSAGGLANRSFDNLPHMSTVDALHSDSHIKDSIVSAQQQQRLVKSEHNSPVLGSASTLGQLNGQLPPLNLSAVDGFSNDYNVPMGFEGFPAVREVEQPIFSAGLSASSVDWSLYDGLEFNNDGLAASTFSQPPSFTGFDFSSVDQPALTRTSTSGEVSEVEDFVPVRPSQGMQKYESDFDNSDSGDNEGYRLSTASSYMGLPQVQMLANNDIGSIDMDDFLRGAVSPANYGTNSTAGESLPITPLCGEQKFAPMFDEGSFQLAQLDDEDALWMGNYTSNGIPLGNRASEITAYNGWAQ